MGAEQILVVDDDAGLCDLLSMALEDAGYTVATARNGRIGWETFSAAHYDLVILDLLMPEMDGLELLRRIRVDHHTIVIMLTSRGEEMDKLLGLESGADDYVTKPFSMRELIARVRAALRRVRRDRDAQSSDVLDVRGVHMDRTEHRVKFMDVDLEVTATEFELLWALIQSPGKVLSRNTLIDRVYGEDIVVADRTIDTFVKRLRAKMRRIDPQYDDIETIRSVGYRYRA